MRLPPYLRLAGLAAVLGGLLAQGALPAVHAWRVGAAETEYHACAPAAAVRATASPEREASHEHHSETDCALCPFLARSGGAAPNAVRPAGSPGPGDLPPPHRLGLAASPGRPAAPLRGPPAVA